jgi:hypothetical protein
MVYDVNASSLSLSDPNYSFLPDSALLQPEISLDAYGALSDGQDFEYGAFVFWRFLSEYDFYGFVPAGIVREVWDRAVGTTALSATVGEVNQRAATAFGGEFQDIFVDFAAWNRAYTAFYDEGLGYWNSLLLFMPWDAVFRLGNAGTTGPRTMSVSRLSTRYVALYPHATVPDGYNVVVDLPPALARSSAVMVVTAPFDTFDFCAQYFYMDGNGDASVEFSKIDNPCTGALDPIDISQVFLVLSNPTSATRTEAYQASVTP